MQCCRHGCLIKWTFFFDIFNVMNVQIVQLPPDDAMCTHDFVRFVNAVYAVPSIRSLLEAFVKESIFDISLLLLCAWSGFLGMQPLKRTFLLPLMHWLARWQKTVSTPLADCLKVSAQSPLHEGVIACDQLNQNMVNVFIIDALRIEGLVTGISDDTLGVAKANFAVYCKLLNLVPSGAACHRVRQLLTEIYNHRALLILEQVS